MQTNPAVEQSKVIRWSESPCNQPVCNKGITGSHITEPKTLDWHLIKADYFENLMVYIYTPCPEKKAPLDFLP